MTTFTRRLLRATAIALYALAPTFAVHAQPNDPADAQEQSEMKASIDENIPFVPYKLDPRLSDKVATLQPLFDYFRAAASAVPRNFSHYNRYKSEMGYTKRLRRCSQMAVIMQSPLTIW
jgi:hypothetical protein